MDINNFGPFRFEVWGNVSDWAMVIVTAITGILILLTFRSQQKLQKLENEIYRLRIKPEIVIITDPLIISLDQEFYPFDISIENADVFDLRIEITSKAEAIDIIWLRCFMHPTSLQKGSFQHTRYSYSGPYVLTDRSFDPNLIILENNL